MMAIKDDVMKFPSLNAGQEKRIIRLGIIVFWWLFWLLNVIDKFIGKSTFLWVGKDRLGQFVTYFSSIGIENSSVAAAFLIFVTIVEMIALLFMTFALGYTISGNESGAHRALYFGILTSLFLFSFFTIGDQIFGDRHQLLEHALYWMALILSWFIYTRAEETEQQSREP